MEFPEGLPTYMMKITDATSPLYRKWLCAEAGNILTLPEDFTVFLCPFRGIELVVMNEEDPLDREEGDAPRFQVCQGPHAEVIIRRFETENWEEALQTIILWAETSYTEG